MTPPRSRKHPRKHSRKHPRKHPSQRRGASVSDREQPAESFSFSSEGQTVRAYRRGAGPLVLLVHGWGGNAAQFSRLETQLVRSGFSTVSVDFPAHGGSPGRTTNAFEMRRVLLDLVRRVGQPRLVVAHSFGAMVTGLALRSGLLPQRCAMVAPMTSFRYAFDAFSVELRLSPLMRKRLEARLQRQFGISQAGMEIEQHPPDRAVRLLVVHDSEDSRVPQRLSLSLVDAWPDAEFLPTTGLGHQRVLKDSTVISAIVRFASGDDDARRATQLDHRVGGGALR